MVQGYRRLDETLVKTVVRAAGVRPKLFPDVMSLKIILTVEKQDSRQVARVVVLGGLHHGSFPGGSSASICRILAAAGRGKYLRIFLGRPRSRSRAGLAGLDRPMPGSDRRARRSAATSIP